ncbi:MAG: hypothetical protein JWR80_6162 [Bradyrhizobium sp.]|nr:hypothetical protein [Bradyrhizobium sp.]
MDPEVAEGGERQLAVTLWKDGSAIALAVGRVVGALCVSFLFTVILMTAIAQQNTLAQLGEGTPKLSYSSAYTLVQDIEERRDRLKELHGLERGLDKDKWARAAHVSALQSENDAAWRAFMPLVRRVSSACAIQLSTEAASQEWRMAFWSEATQCRIDGRMSPSLLTTVAAIQKTSRSFMDIAQELGRSIDDSNLVSSQLDSVRAQIKTARELNPDEAKAWNSFDESNVLRKQRLFGGEFLIAFPPSLLQLLLALASGAFGALLVTLVLVVYPRTTLSIASGGGYGARILLGALIAVCVYIMLLGGTAVLGANEALSGAGANYMSFCAVAVLAGMFSDRVAAWLSTRANTFFQQQSSEG